MRVQPGTKAIADGKIAPSDIDISGCVFSGLIFDCDGTLADTGELHLRSFQDALAQQGFAMDADWYHARGGLARVELLQRFRSEFDVDLDCRRAAWQSIAAFGAMVSRVRPIEATVRIVEQFQGKIPMAVASNAERSVVLATLRATGLLEAFSAIVTITEAILPKPAPRVFLMAADLLRLPPEECLVFEDSAEGLAAAHAARMKAIDVRPYRTR
jgi:beta-phosphoglucomutase-like phosphatase (HAD superfamily)